MDLTTLQRDTLEVIVKHPSSNPITGKEIAGAIGLKPRSSGKDGSDMRSIINALRVKGYPICAAGTGYYYPETSAELAAYIASFEGRIDDQRAAVDGMKRGYDKVGGYKGGIVVAENTILIYEAMVDGERKIFKIIGTQVDALLAKYPQARKV